MESFPCLHVEHQVQIFIFLKKNTTSSSSQAGKLVTTFLFPSKLKSKFCHSAIQIYKIQPYLCTALIVVVLLGHEIRDPTNYLYVGLGLPKCYRPVFYLFNFPLKIKRSCARNSKLGLLEFVNGSPDGVEFVVGECCEAELGGVARAAWEKGHLYTGRIFPALNAVDCLPPFFSRTQGTDK